MRLVSLGPRFASELRGVDLIDVATNDAAYCAVREAFDEHSVMLFRNQETTDDVQVAFSRAFGPLERTKVGSRSDLWLTKRDLRGTITYAYVQEPLM
jgi:alpha-ketoglutarate-dependent 2,4-dichlorophenoxyacetate dioxygenase